MEYILPKEGEDIPRFPPPNRGRLTPGKRDSVKAWNRRIEGQILPDRSRNQALITPRAITRMVKQSKEYHRKVSPLSPPKKTSG